MTNYYPLPEQIKNLNWWLAQAKTHQQTLSYNPEKWLEIDNKTLSEVAITFSGQIMRQDIINMAKQFHQGESDLTLRHIIMTTMLWGYSMTAYGPWRVTQMLGDTELDHKLLNVYKLVKENNLMDAYRHFQQYPTPYLGSSYFTKFLYFVGLGIGINQYPLILDDRVINSLGALLTNHVPKRDHPDNYINYVQSLHNWAKELNCDADKIEHLLFLLPASFWSFG